MPTLASSNRSQLAYKLEGTYPTNFGVPQGGNGTNVNMTGETLDFNIKTEKSKQIRSDRQTLDNVQVSAQSAGGFNFEAQYKDYDWAIEGVLQQAFNAYGTSGKSAAIATLTLAAGTITAGAAPTGNDAFTNLQKGQWIILIPPSGATQAVKDYFAGRPFRISSTIAPTATVITLDAATQINTAIAGTSMSNGVISSSYAYNGTTMKSYTLEVGHADINQFRQYVGMIPSKMSLKFTVGQILTGTFDFMGKSMNLLQATGMGSATPAQTFTPANATKGIFDILEGGSSVTATTYIKSGELMIDNSLRIQEAVGVFGAAGIAAGTLVSGGKLEVYFADAVMYQKFISGSSSSLSIPVLDVNGNGYVYYFPRIKYSAAKVNVGGLDQDLTLSMDFDALMDIDPTSPTYQKTVAIYRVGN